MSDSRKGLYEFQRPVAAAYLKPLYGVYMIRILAILTLAIFVLTGCGTMLGRSNNEKIYPGVRTDAEIFSEYSENNHAADLAEEILLITFLSIYCLIDMPISFVADTVWLPVDLIAINNEPEEKKPYNHEMKADEN